ncbi:glutamate--tRNA ligase [Aurantibacillus circumpalustris]|uniref:glutamate--tRNA ligase n=1 Tax=Aurantibacillus circumpalustris TaxID=3036359 RepID=UPI00295B8029|nr:glutamate--tRNA ligase [Aurantibacillus circumpalustris]
MEKRVRVRFAPSPTGGLHMGGVRTALFNYLFAKRHGGDFILRIEDTDQTRFVEGAEEYIVSALKWCGIEPNEGVGFGDGPHKPYRQSERKELGIYKKYADKLIASGHAYYAFDTSEELDAMRKRLEAAKMVSPQYNAVTRQNMRNSLTLPEDEVKKLLESGEKYVVRLKVPRNEEIRFNDIIRGWVTVNSAQVDDKVLLKSDGMPTYHLAHIVDDIEMEISHAVRGEEWLPSAPAHILIYKYLGLENEMPKLAHLPLILNPDGNGKISKREARFPVFPLSWKDPREATPYIGYKESGYYPEAFVNVLALLGWNPGNNEELFTVEELSKIFEFERVHKSGAKFDPEKAKWFNQQYLRKKSDEELSEAFKPILKEKGFERDAAFMIEFCKLVKEKVQFVHEFWDHGKYIFIAPDAYDEKVMTKKWNPQNKELVTKALDCFKGITDWKTQVIHDTFEALVKEVGKIDMQLLRVLITGVAGGPQLFDMLALMGKDEVINRMNTALSKL